jgi:hypothetical protein
MSKIICVLYPDPVDGYPKSYVRDDLPKLTHYPGGQTLPTPRNRLRSRSFAWQRVRRTRLAQIHREPRV